MWWWKMRNKLMLNAKGVPLEDREQMTFFAYVNTKYAFTKDERYRMIFAVPNGAKRNMAFRMKMKHTGLLAGVPDIMVDFSNGKYHGLRIEMKAKKGGRVRPEQKEMIERYNNFGYKAVVCYGADEAIKTLEDYFKGE